MTRKHIKVIIGMILFFAVSCDEPETIVTNIVHSDGSVLRKIEVRSKKNKLNPSELQVPFDSSWSVKDSTEVNAKYDTTWVRRAEKLFKNVDEINLAYKCDSGSNKDVRRSVFFSKKFRWFNTVFRFSERIDNTMSFGYPVNKFLNEEELRYFYSPGNLKYDLEHSSDSLKYRALSDSVNLKTDKWTMATVVSDWIGEFTKLTAGREEKEVSKEYLKSRESDMIKTAEETNDKFDSLWKAGTILKKFIGEANALKYRTEADSAISLLTNDFLFDFKDYSVGIVMPGKLTSTNGFIDSSKRLLWPVKTDFFLTQPYEMWAESKIPNRWTWYVSGGFLAFVLTGVVIRIIKKG